MLHECTLYVHPLYLEVNYYQQIWSRDWIVGSHTEVLLLSTIYFASNREPPSLCMSCFRFAVLFSGQRFHYRRAWHRLC